MGDASTRSQLKKLRDELVAQSQQAPTFPGVSAELVRRLRNVAARVSEVYLQCSSPLSQASTMLDEVYDDALVEGHLALSDWSRWAGEQQSRKAPRALPPVPPSERRVHARELTVLSIKLLQHHLRDDGLSLVVDDEAVDCPTRDVSSGGVFVVAALDVLPTVVTGQLLHVALPAVAGSLEQKARAVVIRRDATGMALRWIVESPHDKRAVEGLVSAIRARWLAAP